MSKRFIYPVIILFAFSGGLSATAPKPTCKESIYKCAEMIEAAKPRRCQMPQEFFGVRVVTDCIKTLDGIPLAGLLKLCANSCVESNNSVCTGECSYP